MRNLDFEYLLKTLADPFELSNIAFYFAPHWETFPNPIRSSDFCTSLERCNIFLLEYSEQWMVQEPDLECKYNRLAHGEIRRIREGMLARADYLSKPYTDELEEKIHGCNKRILLERPTGPYVDTEEKQIAQLIKSGQVDEAISLDKNRQHDLANSMVQRDDSLVDLIEEQIREKRLFVLRGAAHERYVTSLFGGKLSMPTVLRFEKPPLSVRLVGALTMSETVDDLDFLRHIYALVQCDSDYLTYLNLQKQAESMSDNELRISLRKWVSG